LITLLLLSPIRELLFDVENKTFLIRNSEQTFVLFTIMVICPWIVHTFKLIAFDMILKDTSSNSLKNIFEVKEKTDCSLETIQTVKIREVDTYFQSLLNEEDSDSETKITI